MRKPAGLDFGDMEDFAPKGKVSRVPNAEKDVAKKIAKEIAVKEGFTSRQVPEKVDGRTLRKTEKKAQLNIAVKPKTKDRFWAEAQSLGFAGGEEFLCHLLDSLGADS